MASIKIKGTLESADLLGFPLTLTLNQSYTGAGKIKAFQKFETTVKASPINPSILPGTAFSSADKKVYIYIKNTSITATEHVNLYIKYTTVLTAVELNAKGCCTECEEGALEVDRFVQIAKLGHGEHVFIPLAEQDQLYTDSDVGTPVLDYLVLEN
jgi:hypothetical protein